MVLTMKDKFKIFTKLILIITIVIFSLGVKAQSDWKKLFNGKDLSGWEIKNGTAKYTIEGDAIVGTSRDGTPNTFLCTKKKYSDFIFEVEVLVSPGLNSGIQFRSNSIKSYRNGRVHGYQSELDTSERAWTGGIFDEGRRGWLYPLTMNKNGSGAFRNGYWNKVRIEAIGNSIKTFINGIQCSNLVDDMTSEGFIALQVHSIKGKELEGKTIKWKNIRIVTEDLDSRKTPSMPYARQISYLKNTLTPEEESKGWKLLWDGKTSTGWKGAEIDFFPESGITLENGIIHFHPHKIKKDPKRSGDIVTIEKFSNFELELDFKVQKGGNSGIKYFVDALQAGDGRTVGLEFQILDNAHEDFKMGVNGNRTVGSLYDLISSENLSELQRNVIEKKSLNYKLRSKGPNEWNKARIIVKGGNVEHWLNNILVVKYDRFSQTFKNLIKKSKFYDKKGFGVANEGRILLQDHHPGDIKFKNIKIREL
jgi:hypothetical protein